MLIYVYETVIVTVFMLYLMKAVKRTKYRFFVDHNFPLQVAIAWIWLNFGLRHFLGISQFSQLEFVKWFLFLRKSSIFEISGIESIWKFNESVGWTEDTLDSCRKILQPPTVVKFIFLSISCYLIYLNNKNHELQITDLEFISSVFIVSNGQDRYWWK